VILYSSGWQSETVVDRPIDRIQEIAVKTVVDRRSDDANKLANQGSKLENPDFVLFLAAQNLQTVILLKSLKGNNTQVPEHS
jgi:hypothetical protein